MIANDANAPNMAARRLCTTGNRTGSTTEVADRKNEKKPTTAVSIPIKAISNASLEGFIGTYKKSAPNRFRFTVKSQLCAVLEISHRYFLDLRLSSQQIFKSALIFSLSNRSGARRYPLSTSFS